MIFRTLLLRSIEEGLISEILPLNSGIYLLSSSQTCLCNTVETFDIEISKRSDVLERQELLCWLASSHLGAPKSWLKIHIRSETGRSGSTHPV